MDTIEPEKRPNDSVGRGFGLAVLCQLGCIVLMAVVCAGLPQLSFIVLEGWGLMPLIVLIPFFMAQLNSGHSLTAKGVAIAGSIGFLLNAACDALVYLPSRFR